MPPHSSDDECSQVVLARIEGDVKQLLRAVDQIIASQGDHARQIQSLELWREAVKGSLQSGAERMSRIEAKQVDMLDSMMERKVVMAWIGGAMFVSSIFSGIVVMVVQYLLKGH